MLKNSGKNHNLCLFSFDERNKRITWEITEKCNFKCLHCCVSADISKDNSISLKETEKIIDQFYKNKIKKLYISGGEPFISDNLFTILKRASLYKIEINLATNGSLITEKIVKKLSNFKLNSILVSLDGQNKTIHDEFRGVPYAFEKAINAIKILKSYNFKIKIGTVIWKKNINKLEDIIKLAISLNADRIYFSWLVLTGRAEFNKRIMPPEKLFNKTKIILNLLKYKYKEKIDVSFKRFEFEKNKSNYSDCPGALYLFHMDSKGYIYPCSWFAKVNPYYRSDFSIKEKPLSDLLRSKRLIEFRKIIVKRRKKYGISCPAMCLMKNGTINSIDPLKQ